MFKEIIHEILVYFGIRPCCDAPKIVERTSLPEFYQYECLNCGNTRSGGASSHQF